jgi:hypothetical protein
MSFYKHYKATLLISAVRANAGVGILEKWTLFNDDSLQTNTRVEKVGEFL